MSAVHPGGPAAAAIASLWWVMLVGATVIFAFVMGLLALAMRPTARPVTERVWIKGLGLAFPFAVLAALLAYGIAVGERLLPRAGDAPLVVQAEARQWEWRFGHPNGVVIPNTLHIPAGQPVDVEITTVDVIHSFWVPRLAGKLDAVPGHVNVLRIEAWRPGDYAGVSSEFSGPGYRTHGFTVRAHDPAAWQRFLSGEGDP